MAAALSVGAPRFQLSARSGSQSDQSCSVVRFRDLAAGLGLLLRILEV